MHFLKVDDMTIELAGVKGRREGKGVDKGMREDNVKVREEVRTGRMEEDLGEAEPSSLSSFGNQGGQENYQAMIKGNSSKEKKLLVAHSPSQAGEDKGRPF